MSSRSPKRPYERRYNGDNKSPATPHLRRGKNKGPFTENCWGTPDEGVAAWRQCPGGLLCQGFLERLRRAAGVFLDDRLGDSDFPGCLAEVLDSSSLSR
jgi:hypothetical protein